MNFEKKKQLKFIGICLIVMFLWGSLFPCIKLGYKAFGTQTDFVPNLILFAGVRFLICGGVLTVISLVTKQKMLPPKNKILYALGASFTAIVLHYTCTYAGLTMTDSGKTAILKQLCAVLFVCITALKTKTGNAKVRTFFGALLGFVGIIAINYDSGISIGIGEGLIFAASVCMVVSNVLGQHVLTDMSPIPYTAATQLLGGIILTVAGLALGGSIGTWSLPAIGILLYICTASTVAYVLWFSVVRVADLSYLFIIKMAEPLFAAFCGAVLLGENIFQLRYLVSVLCIGGAIWYSSDVGEKYQKKKKGK